MYLCAQLRILGLFCKRALLKRIYSATKTHHPPPLPPPSAVGRTYYSSIEKIRVALRKYVRSTHVCTCIHKHVNTLNQHVDMLVCSAVYRCVGVAEYSLFNRALLQKRPRILRSLLHIRRRYIWGGYD